MWRADEFILTGALSPRGNEWISRPNDEHLHRTTLGTNKLGGINSESVVASLAR